MYYKSGKEPLFKLFGNTNVAGTRTKGRVIRLLLVGVSILATTEVWATLPTAESKSRTFRVAKGGDLLIVPVDIGTGRYPFVLDTGSSVSSFDVSLQPLLRGRTGATRAQTQNGTREMDLFAAPPMSVGGIPLDGVRDVLCVDCDRYRKVVGEAICGVLGMDALKKLTVQIDFDRGELALLDSLPEKAGEQFPLTYVRGLPSVLANINPRDKSGGARQTTLSIDTGCTFCIHIKPQLFDALVAARGLTPLGKDRCETIAGVTDARLGKLTDFRLGAAQHANLLVFEGQVNSLSLDYLSRYRVTFDFPNDRMYLLPGDHFNEADRCDLSGMDLIRVGGDTIVESVDEGGAADNAGLAEGDVILDIGGTSAASLSMIDLSRIFCTPSTRSLIVRRPGWKVRLTIELEEKRNDVASGGAAGGDAQPAQSGGEPSGGVQRNFTIGKHGNPILLPVEIGSERHTFLFDTGTPITSFDVSLKRLLLGRSGSRSVRSQFDFEGADTELFVAPPMSLGGDKLRGIAEVTCLDQAALRAELGEEFDGVLGMDAIYFLTVQIDFDGGQLSVLPSVPKDAREWMKLTLVTGHLRAVDMGWIGEDAGIFIIDTGYVSLGSGSLNSRRFRSLVEARQASLITSRPTATAVRPTRSREAKLASFAVSEPEHNDLIFQEGPLNALSLNFLSRYLVTICFSRGRMYLKPGARFNCPDLRDLSAMKLAKHDGKVVVESLDPDCAGERAGIRSGDVLVEIDGIAVETLTLLDLRRMLGERLTRSLTIRRGTETQQAKLDLRDSYTGGS